MYRLTFLNGRFKGRRFAVQQGALLIGRDPSCQIDLADDDLVSHQHAQIESRKDGVWLKDLGALNPAQVNGAPVDEVKLRAGDRIEIGRTQFEFQPVEANVTTPHRRKSRLRMLTVLAIAGIVLLEVTFIVFFPMWQRQYTEEPEVVEVGSGMPEDAALATDALSRVQALAATAYVTTAVPASAEIDPALQAEVHELKQALSGLREQVQSLATQPISVAGASTNGIPLASTALLATATASVSATSAPAIVAALTSTPVVAVVTAAPEPIIYQSTPAPTVGVVAVRVPPPEETRPQQIDPLAAKVRELLLLAQTESQKGNLAAADLALERLLILSPDSVPGLVERARVYEKRSMLKEAGAIWAQILPLTVGTPLYTEAVAERQRLAREEARLSTIRDQRAPRGAPAALPQRIRIVSVDRERFRGNSEFDEMRLIRIHLRPRMSEGRIEADDVEVRVAFYDRVVGSVNVVPTGATVPTAPLRVDSTWGPGEQKSLTATYVLPRHFREKEELATNQKRTYEGYRVQLWYKEELQDEEALPRGLLKEPMPDLVSPMSLPVQR